MRVRRGKEGSRAGERGRENVWERSFERELEVAGSEEISDRSVRKKDRRR